MARTSVAERKMRGTYRSDRPGRPSTGKKGAKIAMPRGMGSQKHAAQLWRMVVDDLGHIMRPVDVAALAMACRHYEIAMSAYETLLEEGVASTEASHSHTPRKHPLTTVFQANSDRCIAILKSFAALPRERAALMVDEQRDDDWISRIFEGL